MNENAVLYALSTLAQTCAALAAFVGAIGLFLLQLLRERRQATEVALRPSLVDVYDNHDVVMYGHSTAEVVEQAQKARNDSSRASGDRAQRIERAFKAYLSFAPAIRQSVRVLILFEGWNVMVIVMSLGGFAHVLTLTGASWASYLLWLIAVVTGVITGAAVGSFVWFARSTDTA